jgi:hypothetical protein
MQSTHHQWQCCLCRTCPDRDIDTLASTSLYLSLPGLCAKLAAAAGDPPQKLPAVADVFRMSREAAAGAIAAGLNLSEQVDTELATLGQLLRTARVLSVQALAICTMLSALAGMPALQEAHAKALSDFALDAHAVWLCPAPAQAILGFDKIANRASYSSRQAFRKTPRSRTQP